ncbi:MAG: response regulator transcription factor [Bacteroidota bacterium]
MKLLFAEDDDLLRNSLTFYLKNNGYSVTAVSNGMEVKEQLKISTFDLVITDLNMPFLGGMEVISFVRNELKSSTPIIVLTSFGIEKAELDAFEIGASEFVTKPFSPSVLKARIEKLLAKSQKKD